jgi:hypothetical protein
MQATHDLTKAQQLSGETIAGEVEPLALSKAREEMPLPV